ncbi:Sugar phosphate isomerase/epimerase [Paracoccus saliphilus]|uniref:Sugar phosphate isomerase/epimerase n=2 Tax=Paracoccus saliphilus TaxID=405559 RepID=A0AA45W7U7_9RHOB|nr:sugar phosphate isomerase/epimerase [Paracoccus saliphilus]SIT12390.1 Sugar phosphate isomerase/epimerase [Paracoccus saliphilus]
MKVAAVTNEVAPLTSPGSLKRIFEIAVEAGITTFEARTVEGKRFPLLTGAAWETLKQASRTYGITYSAASPGLFIGAGIDSDLIDLHANQLWSMSLDLAEKLETDTVITFAPLRSVAGTENEFERVAMLLGKVADSASQRGFQVQLENLPGTWADTSDSCLALLEAVGRSNFGYVWDTGNLYEAEGVTFEAGFEKLKPYIRNVHLKDGRLIDGKMVWEHYGTGVTNLKGQIEALKAFGYEGTLALEAARIPHQEEDFETSLAYLKTIL